MDVAPQHCVVPDARVHFISLFNWGMACLKLEKVAQEGSCQFFPRFLSHLYVLCPSPAPDNVF